MSDTTTAAACCAPLGDLDLSDDQVEAAATIFKAMADPARVRIVNLLAAAGEPICACDLEAPTGLSQPTVSYHMKRLVAAGLVASERRGTWVYYQLDPGGCAKLAEVADLTATEPAATVA